MIEFTEEYYQNYGISKPQDDPLLTEYNVTINDQNPLSGITIKHEFHYTIEKFIINKINDSFDKLISEYYDTIRFKGDPVEKAAYYKLIYNQLTELYRKLKQKEFITIYLKFFKNGIDLFKEKFGYISTQRATYQRQLENSFEILVSDRITQEDVIYKLERIFNALKVNDFLPLSTEKKDFIRLFSGNIIYRKVRWKGTLSSFYYFNKKLNKLSFIKDLKHNKWSVAHKCFLVLNKDSIEYSSSKFRLQKNPTKKVMEVLDEILDI
ncbi:hypothetical protein [Psychroserpens mesophilus]|uniref:hypothetical protein n=1 Tax=Psychroserpens mesophilus TaxID=325473 RepID=UPI003D64C369